MTDRYDRSGQSKERRAGRDMTLADSDVVSNIWRHDKQNGGRRERDYAEKKIDEMKK